MSARTLESKKDRMIAILISPFMSCPARLVIYGVEEGPKLIGAIQQNFTSLSALSFMVMSLLYVPCLGTVAAIRKETNSKKWAVIAALISCLIGWVGAVLVYQIGRVLGFS